MEYDFSYLIYKYTLAGARAKFEDICNDLLRAIHGPDAHNIRVARGDGGIDGMTGDFSGPIQVYQCKYFPSGIGSSQRTQITDSFQRAYGNKKFRMSEWTLCVSCDLSQEEMAWWSDWKAQTEAQTQIPITLFDGGYLLSQLKQHGLYDEVFDVEARQLLKAVRELSESCRKLLSSSQGFFSSQDPQAPELLTPELVTNAACDCTDEDVLSYYKVDRTFLTMLRVICAGEDVPHPLPRDEIQRLLKEGHSVILSGNGGMGKSSLMLRSAVQWVREGNPAVWLSLSERQNIDAGQAKALYDQLLSAVPQGQRLLICVDDPFDGQASLDQLRRQWRRDPRLLLMTAERTNRLSMLASRNSNRFQGWFENAVIVSLDGLDTRDTYRLKPYTTISCPETEERRRAVLDNCLLHLERRRIIAEGRRSALAAKALNKYGSDNVSLVELIYRTLFLCSEETSKPEELRLDWDEWKLFIRRELDKNVSARRLYGVIASCSMFGVPISVSLFCRIFRLDEYDLIDKMQLWRMDHRIEPVIYRQRDATLHPKHGVIAELFYLFQDDNFSLSTPMPEVLDQMDELEAEKFLDRIVTNKYDMQSSRFDIFENIDYWTMLQKLLRRDRSTPFNLSEEARATLLLGLIWTVPRRDRSGRKQEVLDILRKDAPPIGDGIHFAKLYTEWGKLLAEDNQLKAAEEKLRAVTDNFPTQLHARTELGRLLAKQKGRESEAEKFLREILSFDSKNIQARTELGRLLAKQKGRESEAEKFLKEAMQIDPKHIQSRTELGRLLAKQKGREKEAEEFLRDAIRIDPQNLHPHTELGRLLAKQKGRENEAEKFLREAMRIDSKHLHSRNVLAELYIQLGRPAEAEVLYNEMLRIDSKNPYAKRGLEQLRRRT